MTRSAKLVDVAKAAGVSQGTASNVFNRPELVRPEVRARVEASARRLGYCGPDPRGRLLRAGKVNAIGIVMADEMGYSFRDPYQRVVMAGIADECDARGAGLALVSAKRATEGEAAWRIKTAVVDGFIVNCIHVGAELVASARERNLPFVAMDLDAGPGTSSVTIEERRGGYLAASHLLELGHRKIGLLAIETCAASSVGWSDAGRLQVSDAPFERDRAAGYAEALAERGVELDKVPVLEMRNEREDAARWTTELLSAHPEVTAVLAMSDVLALGALDAARARGLRVPEDFSIVGFDDVPDASLCTPQLTTVSQPIIEKGRLAARLIFDGGPPRAERLPVKLVVRGSTAAPRSV